MRMRTIAWVAAATLATSGVAAGVAGALPAGGTASADGTTMLVGASLTIDKTSLSGTDLAVMTVTVHLKDTSGLRPDHGCPCAGLQAVDGTGAETALDPEAVNDRDVRLGLQSGTLMDGYWSGHALVGAINAGNWQLTGLNAGSINDYSNEQDQRGLAPVPGAAFGAEVTFTGSHWPELTLSLPQKPVTYPTTYVVSGSAYWSDTHQPIPNLPLSYEPGERTFQHQALPPRFVTTDSDGNWSAAQRSPVFTAALVFAPSGLSRYGGTEWVSQAKATGRTTRYHVTIRHHGLHMSVCLDPSYSVDQELATIQRWSGSAWKNYATWDVLNGCENGYITVPAGSYRATFPTDVDAETVGNTSPTVAVTR